MRASVDDGGRSRSQHSQLGRSSRAIALHLMLGWSIARNRRKSRMPIPADIHSAAALLAGFAVVFAGRSFDANSEISARLIAACRVGEVIFAPNRSVT